MSKTKKPIKITWPSFFIVMILLILFGYAIVDATVYKPKVKEKVDYVTTKFDSLKTYLDRKLPEMDAAIIVHTDQINKQNEQLEKLNKLTETLSEK
jgi:predicted solute-binding protein